MKNHKEDTKFREEFQVFLKNNMFRHSFSTPYHPATNGASENFIETFKDKVDKIVKGGRSMESAVKISTLCNWRDSSEIDVFDIFTNTMYAYVINMVLKILTEILIGTRIVDEYWKEIKNSTLKKLKETFN